MTGEELGSLLQAERSLRLMVLNSSRGWEGLARRFVLRRRLEPSRVRNPGRVGMRFEISDEASITFAGRLYNAIAQGFPIAAAMAAVAAMRKPWSR